MFKEKTYAMLPNIKIKSWNKEVLSDLSLSTLLDKKFLPETIINEALLLGWSHLSLETEFKKLQKNDKFKDLISMETIFTDFKLENIKKDKAIFMFERLYFFNNKIMQRKFLYSDKSHKKRVREDFKKVFEEYFFAYKDKTEKWDDNQWDKVMNIVIVCII